MNTRRIYILSIEEDLTKNILGVSRLETLEKLGVKSSGLIAICPSKQPLLKIYRESGSLLLDISASMFQRVAFLSLMRSRIRMQRDLISTGEESLVISADYSTPLSLAIHRLEQSGILSFVSYETFKYWLSLDALSTGKPPLSTARMEIIEAVGTESRWEWEQHVDHLHPEDSPI